MSAYLNKKGRQTKLLAAIAVLAMVVCVFAVVMPSDNVEAEVPTADPFTGMYGEGTAPTYKDGVLSVTDDTIITLSKDIGSSDAPLDFRIEIAAGKTLTIQNTGENTYGVYILYTTPGTAADTSDPSKSVVYGGVKDSTYGVLALKNVDVSLTLDADAEVTEDYYLTNSHVLYNTSISLDEGAVLTISQTAAAGGQSYYIGSTTNLATVTVAGGSQFVFDNANGMSGVNATVSEASSIVAQNTKTGKAWLNFSDLTVSDATSSVKIEDGTQTGLYVTKTLTNSGTVDAGAAPIQTEDAATITNNAGATIKAASISGQATLTNNGTIDAKAQITDESGNSTYISGAVSKDTTAASGAILENVTVNPGVKLTITDSATVKGDMRLYGTIAPVNTAATVTVGQDATLTAYSGATVAKGVKVVSEFNGKIDLSAAMSTVTLNDDIESDFTASQSQKVVIADTLTIKSGYTMEILGELVINEGCTVIIEDGAQLVLGDDTIVSTGMTVNGTIDVEVGGTVDVIKAKDVIINGTIASAGTVKINSTVTVKNGGSIIIDDYEDASGVQQSKIEVDSGLTIENGGQMTVAGDMDITDITNKGTIVLNGANIISSSTISMGANNAVVDIRSMTQASGADLTITDFEMVLGKDNENKLVFKATGTADTGIRGVTVVDKKTVYSNSFVLAGSIVIFDDTDEGFDDSYTVEADGKGSIEVPESLTIGKNVTLTLKSGEMNVDGTIDATAAGATINSSGEINVNGMITTDISSKISSGINAFHYTDDDYNYYTTLKTSVDNGATNIEYIGNVAVLDTLTIPSGTEVSKAANAGTMTIGSEKNRDVIVTVSDGATVRNCTIEVMATLVFDNNKTGNRNNTVYSDVIIDAEPKRTYTNIYTALADAADNSTITIARNVFLNEDAEIRQTITLEIPASYGIYLDNGVTLTVNGTIVNSGAIGNAVAGDNNEPDTTGMVGFNPYLADGVTANEDHATIIVNGTVMSMSYLDYDTYYISGAYYQMVNDKGSWYYITPVEQAAAVSDDVENGAIEILGQNTVSDVTFTGDRDQPVTVTVTGTLKAGTVTLSLAGIDVDGTFEGTVASAVGSVAVVNATGFAVVDTVVGQDSVQTTYLTGNPVPVDKDADSSVTVVTGKINAGQIDTEATTASDFVISSGATLEVSGKYDGAAAKLTVGTMTVDGTLSAVNGGQIVATSLTVRGTLDVASDDDDNQITAGSAEIETLYVGIAQNKDNKFVDASAATVNAESIDKLTKVFISAESTITAELVEKMDSTEFYVEDKLWMTAYVASGTTVDIAEDTSTDPDKTEITYNLQPGDLSNCIFLNWADADGEALGDGAKVGADNAKVYATLDYNIYTITVFADPGIQAVYVDGKLMTSGTFQTGVDGMWAQGFRLSVAAGEHEITYKLGNYFSGEAQMTVNGTAVSGNSFTTSGTTTADRNVTIYLQGIEASAPETPSTPSTDSGDDGMGLTDYLLIVLVILIVIMAIMVAVRLMRS